MNKSIEFINNQIITSKVADTFPQENWSEDNKDIAVLNFFETLESVLTKKDYDNTFKKNKMSVITIDTNTKDSREIQAKYDADIVGKENELKNHIVTVAGKCCESGDLIIENIPLPEAKPGDLLITYTTGAYGYSMSSNYNKALTPAVVFVEGDEAKLVVKRQSYEELTEREI